MLTLIRKPSGFIPIVMSLTAFAIVAGHLSLYGVVREADEGTPAHLFQLLLVLQLPVVAFFAIKWLPRNPGQALSVLALQAVSGLVALAPVFYFNL